VKQLNDSRIKTKTGELEKYVKKVMEERKEASDEITRAIILLQDAVDKIIASLKMNVFDDQPQPQERLQNEEVRVLTRITDELMLVSRSLLI
jgi:hypothetical protein